MKIAVWCERFWQDLRHGARLFAKSPGFTAIAILSIACGTGANVAVFSVADALLLRPLPVARPDELLIVGTPLDEGVFRRVQTSYPDYVDIREGSRSFDGLAAYLLRRVGITTHAGAPTQVRLVSLVSANFFDVLGVRPVLGRGFSADEERVAARYAVAVLSYGLWQQRYEGDPAVLGRNIRIGGIDFTIVGVAPDHFDGLETIVVRESVYIPLAMAPALGDEGIAHLLTAREKRILTVRGRLAAGTTAEEARLELDGIGRNLARAYPKSNREHAITAQTYWEEKLTEDTVDAGLVLLLTILSTAVLAVACANVAGLLGSRAPQRAREISLRMALGAGRRRLVTQLVTESLTLALVGGVCGLAVGHAGIALLRQMQYPTDLIQPPVVAIDERALLFSLAVAVGSAFVFGLAPALQTTRIDLAGTMKVGGAGLPGRARLTTRTNLVTVQIALSLVLVTIAAFSIQVFGRIVTAGPGFRTSQIAKLSIDTAHRQYDRQQAAAFFDRAVDEIRRIPQVTSATATSAMPFWSAEMVAIVPEGAPPATAPRPARAVIASVDEAFFSTMDVRIVEGRPFQRTDDADAAPVAIVNETIARRYWPGGDAVGKRFRIAADTGPLLEVIGVATDAKYLYIVEPPQEALYVPFRQEPRGSMVLLARTAGDSLAAIEPMRAVIGRLDADMPVYDAQTMETFYAARGTGLIGVATEMITSLGVMGTMLTMVGLYGLVSYSVSRRTREIGIRIAIGATYGRVIAMIMRQGMRPSWAGLVAGLMLSVLTIRLLPTFVPTAEQFDPRTYVVIVPLLVGVALLAAFVPARRAARVDPTVALRCE
jgi:putative ABC transport system permease protein